MRWAKEELQLWAREELGANSSVAALDWERIQEEIVETGETLWAREEANDLGAPSTTQAVEDLREAGLALPLVLGGTVQHFGAWLLDYCVVAAAVRMRLTRPVRQYTAVHNGVFGQIAAGTREPDQECVELSWKSQERLGNICETLAGVWFAQGHHGRLRRLILFLVTIVYRPSLHKAAADRTLVRLVAHRRRQTPPMEISEQFQPSGTWGG